MPDFTLIKPLIRFHDCFYDISHKIYLETPLINIVFVMRAPTCKAFNGEVLEIDLYNSKTVLIIKKLL